jgi:hypothetical protein
MSTSRKKKSSSYTSSLRTRTSGSRAEVYLAVLNRAGARYGPARKVVSGWPLVFVTYSGKITQSSLFSPSHDQPLTFFPVLGHFQSVYSDLPMN